MQAGIDFGVVIGALGHAPQAVQLGQQHGQRSACAQHGEHALGLGLHQPPADFLPHPLGHQVGHFARLHHGLHQRHGFGGNAKVGEAGGKAGHAQDAHGVFGKCLGHMAQHFGVQVGHAVIRVKNAFSALPVCGSSYGIDS